MWMAGYGSRDRPADGKLTDLWAKALALQVGVGKRGVVITLDLVGIDRDTAVHIRHHGHVAKPVEPIRVAGDRWQLGRPDGEAILRQRRCALGA